MKRKDLNIKLIATFFATILLTASCTQYSDDEVSFQTETNLELSVIENFDGEDIFKGIFFLDQNFASNIDVLNNSILYTEINKNPSLQKNLNTASTLIMNEINNIDATFFDRFEEMMHSRNEYQISEAIEMGSQKLVEISDLILKENGIDAQTLSTIIASEDYHEIVDEKGNLDKDKLNEYLDGVDENVNFLAADSQNGRCLAAAVVTVAFFVAAGAVLIAGAIAVLAAVNGGVLLALAAAIGVYVEVATPDSVSRSSGNLALEMLVSQVADM